MGKLKVLIVDDHGVVRTGLRSLLEDQDDIEIVGEAASGEEAIAKVKQLNPDLVLMDIAMPGIGGIEATRQIKAEHENIRILILTMHDDEEFAFPLIRAGASGFAVKQAEPKELLSAIRTVGAGGAFFSPELTRSLLKAYFTPETERDKYSILTPREKEVFGLVVAGFKNRDIAQKLFLSVRTVEKHRQSAMQKLDLSGQDALMMYAIRKGLTISD